MIRGTWIGDQPQDVRFIPAKETKMGNPTPPVPAVMEKHPTPWKADGPYNIFDANDDYVAHCEPRGANAVVASIFNTLAALRSKLDAAKIDALCSQLQVADPTNLSLAVESTLEEMAALRSENAELIAQLPNIPQLAPVERMARWKDLCVALMHAIESDHVEPSREVRHAALALGEFLTADRYAYPLPAAALAPAGKGEQQDEPLGRCEGCGDVIREGHYHLTKDHVRVCHKCLPLASSAGTAGGVE